MQIENFNKMKNLSSLNTLNRIACYIEDAISRGYKTELIELNSSLYQELRKRNLIQERDEKEGILVGFLKELTQLEEIEEIVDIKGKKYPIEPKDELTNVILTCRKRITRKKLVLHYADNYLKTLSGLEFFKAIDAV